MKRIVLAAACTAALAAASAAGAQSAEPTDAQIAHIVYTANTIDIDAANEAIGNSSNPKVRAFAEEMIRDHEAVNKQALALAKKLNLKPENNATSKALQQQAAKQLKDVEQLSGAAYNQAYAANEVAYHKQVNAALKDTLIPAADNAELKALLQTGLKLFGEHQAHAEQLVADLR